MWEKTRTVGLMSEHGVSVEYWAGWFWKRAGGRAGFPVDIGYAAMCALEVYIQEAAGLTTFSAVSRLKRDGIRSADGIDERRLHGCIRVSERGAVILVEEKDDEAQKRFTIAHEVAHYILEVRRHQERAADRLGYDFARVLHGFREATPPERIDAWLHNIRTDGLLHFMDRAPAGGYGCARTREAERLADDLAVEILAPRSELTGGIYSFGRMGFPESLDAARQIAERRFGLPDGIAERYAKRVVWQIKGGPSITERFGFSR